MWGKDDSGNGVQCIQRFDRGRCCRLGMYEYELYRTLHTYFYQTTSDIDIVHHALIDANFRIPHSAFANPCHTRAHTHGIANEHSETECPKPKLPRQYYRLITKPISCVPGIIPIYLLYYIYRNDGAAAAVEEKVQLDVARVVASKHSGKPPPFACEM